MHNFEAVGLAEWGAGVNSELQYWFYYLTTSGGDFPTDYLFRTSLESDLGSRDPALARDIQSLGRTSVSLLDVGSGPLSNLGRKLSGIDVTITSCDPLAEGYRVLLDFCSLQDHARQIVFADAENLSAFIEPGRFDVVHASNALDHGWQPFRAIQEMLTVCRLDGFVSIGHFENEAEWEKYTGLHKWNFTLDGEDLVLWNRQESLNVSSLLREQAEIRTQRIDAEGGRQWIRAVLRRKTGFSLKPQSANDMARTYQRNYNALLGQLAARIVETSSLSRDQELDDAELLDARLKLEEMRNSTSWRITGPVRWISDALKRRTSA